jgi:hypothetical protein
MRLAAKVMGGFYAAPPEAVDLALLHLSTTGNPTILDPCAGEGAALAQLAKGLSTNVNRCYAIELSDARGTRVAEVIPNTLAPCAFQDAGITAGTFSLIWCNPPFDDEIGGGGRVEFDFLTRSTRLLGTRGVLAFVCPEHVSENEEVRDYLKAWYRDLARLPFPQGHRRFGEVIVFGIKRAQSTDAALATDDWRYPGTYEIPEGRRPGRFRKEALTTSELTAAVSGSTLTRMLSPPPPPDLPAPPLPLNTGHTALLLASGQLDGVVCPAEETPHVVRGTATKSQRVTGTEHIDNDDGSLTTKTTLSETIELSVRAVGLDGVIHTFQSVPQEEENGT